MLFSILFTRTALSDMVVNHKRMWNKFKPQVYNNLLIDQTM